MKAVILGAGKSTRLLPLTKEIPQSLLKVKDKAILEHQIEFLEKAGITDITVVTGYLSNMIEEFLQDKKVKCLFNPFYSVSGMSMSLWVAKEELKEGFIFLYSDLLFEPSIISKLINNKEDICLAIKKDGLREEAEKVIEKDGRILNISKAKLNDENGEFIGIAKFSKKGAKILIDELEKMAKEDISASFITIIDKIIKENRVCAYDIGKAKFLDIDFPEDLEKAEKFL